MPYATLTTETGGLGGTHVEILWKYVRGTSGTYTDPPDPDDLDFVKAVVTGPTEYDGSTTYYTWAALMSVTGVLDNGDALIDEAFKRARETDWSGDCT